MLTGFRPCHKPHGPADELDARVDDDIDALAALQNTAGGFPFWQRGRDSIPWNSLQATHALVVARDAGHDREGRWSQERSSASL